MIHTSAVIEGRQVTIGYREGKRETDLFTDMDFTLYRGELTTLLGTNGTGKSTLLRTMSATQPYLRGNILLNGRELSSYNERELARHIGVVFTERYMAGGLRVHELVALGRYPYTGFFGRLDENDRLITEAVMVQVGIYHKRDSYLSLDEPTAFLDLPSRIETMSLLHRLAEENGKTILMSTHDVEQALVLADRLWLLSPGNGLECGATEDMILAGRLDRLFPSDNIRFDTEHGSYYPLVHSHTPIALSAADPTLLHWGINLLNRNGFSCLIDENVSVSTENRHTHKNGEIPHISINAVNCISLSHNGTTYTLPSFSALADTIRSMKPKLTNSRQ